MPTQWHLLPTLTGRVKSSLFTCVHSRQLSLAARLHRCHTSHSCYVNNGWTFSGQTSYTHTNIGFKCKVREHMICTLYFVFTTPSQVSFHHHLSPTLPSSSHPPPFPSGIHHAVVCRYEGFLFVCLFLIDPFTLFTQPCNSHPNSCQSFLCI